MASPRFVSIYYVKSPTERLLTTVLVSRGYGLGIPYTNIEMLLPVSNKVLARDISKGGRLLGRLEIEAGGAVNVVVPGTDEESDSLYELAKRFNIIDVKAKVKIA